MFLFQTENDKFHICTSTHCKKHSRRSLSIPKFQIWQSSLYADRPLFTYWLSFLVHMQLPKEQNMAHSNIWLRKKHLRSSSSKQHFISELYLASDSFPWPGNKFSTTHFNLNYRINLTHPRPSQPMFPAQHNFHSCLLNSHSEFCLHFAITHPTSEDSCIPWLVEFWLQDVYFYSYMYRNSKQFMLVLPVSHWDGWLVISWDQLSNETIICFFAPRMRENLNYVVLQICITNSKDFKPESTVSILSYLLYKNIVFPLIKHKRSQISELKCKSENYLSILT